MLDVANRPLAGWRYVAKLIEDKILSAALILLLSPLLALIALAIKLDSPGPVFFRQPRYGFNNGVFKVWKGRTMYHNRPSEAGVP